MTELERVVAFVRRATSGTREEACRRARPGSLHAGASRAGLREPLRRRSRRRAAADELVAEPDRSSRAGLAHRKVDCRRRAGRTSGPASAARLGGRGLIMVPRRGAIADSTRRSVRRGRPRGAPTHLGGGHARPTRGPERRGRAPTGRDPASAPRRWPFAFRGARRRRIACYCELYSDDRTGQIEDVITLVRYRGRGWQGGRRAAPTSRARPGRLHLPGRDATTGRRSSTQARLRGRS